MLAKSAVATAAGARLVSAASASAARYSSLASAGAPVPVCNRAMRRSSTAPSIRMLSQSNGWKAGSAMSYSTASLARSEEHTSELQSLMRISYAVFCLNTKTKEQNSNSNYNHQNNHNETT